MLDVDAKMFDTSFKGGQPYQFPLGMGQVIPGWDEGCLLYTSDAADERSSVDLGGRRIIKKKKTENWDGQQTNQNDIKETH